MEQLPVDKLVSESELLERQNRVSFAVDEAAQETRTPIAGVQCQARQFMKIDSLRLFALSRCIPGKSNELTFKAFNSEIFLSSTAISAH